MSQLKIERINDDFEIEPVKGLPEQPPEGERILWQGRPDTWHLAVEALKLKWVAGYFLLLALWRFVSQLDLLPLGQAIGSAVPFLLLGLVTCGHRRTRGDAHWRSTHADAQHSLHAGGQRHARPAARRHRYHRP